jgi:hypothetical protein
MSRVFSWESKHQMHSKSQPSEKPASSSSPEPGGGVIEFDSTQKTHDFRYLTEEGRGGGRGPFKVGEFFRKLFRSEGALAPEGI